MRMTQFLLLKLKDGVDKEVRVNPLLLLMLKL